MQSADCINLANVKLCANKRWKHSGATNMFSIIQLKLVPFHACMLLVCPVMTFCGNICVTLMTIWSPV